MRTDMTPAKIAAYTVLQDRHEVQFKDASTTSLHRVLHQGTVSRHLRGLSLGGPLMLVFDVRGLAPTLGADLPAAPARDVDGLINWTLRLNFASAATFCTAALATLHAPASRKPGSTHRTTSTENVEVAL